MRFAISVDGNPPLKGYASVEFVYLFIRKVRYEKNLQLSLFLLHLTVFAVMWTVDKFVNPTHAALIYRPSIITCMDLETVFSHPTVCWNRLFYGHL